MSEPVPSSESCSENLGPMILAVDYSLVAIATVTVALRLHLRLRSRSGIKADDYSIVASLAAGIIGTGLLTKLVSTGLGRHIWCLPLEQVLQSLKWSTIAQMFNVIGIGLAKVSVCLCVLRMIDRTRTNLATSLYVLIAFVSASHSLQVILFIVQCRPMAAIWNPHIHGKCFSPHITYLAGYIGFGLDASTDLICAGIPIFVLHHLQINQRTKIGICCLMGLGSLTAGCAIAKAITLKNIFATDSTFALTKPAICTIVEHLTSVTLVSLPALKPLFNKILDISRVSFSSSKRSSRLYIRQTLPETTRSSYALKKSSRNHDPERGGAPLRDTILKTTSFRLSSHNSIASRHPDDNWPLPPTNVHTPRSERYERSIGGSDMIG